MADRIGTDGSDTLIGTTENDNFNFGSSGNPGGDLAQDFAGGSDRYAFEPSTNQEASYTGTATLSDDSANGRQTTVDRVDLNFFMGAITGLDNVTIDLVRGNGVRIINGETGGRLIVTAQLATVDDFGPNGQGHGIEIFTLDGQTFDWGATRRAYVDSLPLNDEGQPDLPKVIPVSVFRDGFNEAFAGFDGFGTPNTGGGDGDGGGDPTSPPPPPPPPPPPLGGGEFVAAEGEASRDDIYKTNSDDEVTKVKNITYKVPKNSEEGAKIKKGTIELLGDQPDEGEVTIKKSKVRFKADEDFDGEETVTITYEDKDGNIFTQDILFTGEEFPQGVPGDGDGEDPGPSDEPIDLPFAVVEGDESIYDGNNVKPLKFKVEVEGEKVRGKSIEILSETEEGEASVKAKKKELRFRPDEDYDGFETIEIRFEDKNGQLYTQEVDFDAPPFPVASSGDLPEEILTPASSSDGVA